MKNVGLMKADAKDCKTVVWISMSLDLKDRGGNRI